MQASRQTKHENGDEFALVLELPETDHLFERKKKVLHDVGRDPESLMHMESFSRPHQMDDLLDVFVKRARVISFNEVELYFGGDTINLGDFISPRNELEALHSLLRAIDKSLSGKNYTNENMKDRLKEEIIKRIGRVGNTYTEETKVIIDFSRGKEKDLLDWGVNNGIKTKLDIAYIEGAGRGAIAREHLKVGDIALEVPVALIMSGELLYESNMFPILGKIDGISEETLLLLWSMKEKHNKMSKFKLYFDTLPEKFNTGLSFGIGALMALDGTLLLEEIVQATEHLRAQYNELFPALSKENPDVFPSEFYTWDKFLWACELWYSNSMKLIFPDGKLRTCLIPIAGFLNHSICPHIIHYGRIDATTNSLTFPLSRPCASNEQCFLSYGNFSDSHLLTFYGFLPKGDNPYNFISLDIDAVGNEETEVVAHLLPEWSSHMVRGTWLSKNHEIFHYGLPAPLLDHLRGATNLVSPSEALTREHLETDIVVLRDLSSIFEGMMDGHQYENPEYRESTSWDVKLAMEFKNSQRRIISSIITSCNVGCELLQSELCKYAVLEHEIN